MYPFSQSDIDKSKQFIRIHYTENQLRYLGNGKESVIYTDGTKVYKLIHDKNEEWMWVGLQLPGRFRKSKRFVDVEEFHPHDEYFVIIYSFEESTEYISDRHIELIEFAIESYDFGVICRDLKFGNFRVFEEGIKLVDIGRDLVPFNFKDYVYMIQRMYLLINHPNNPRLREIIRNALKDWDLPELQGFNTFFNDVWMTLIDENFSFKTLTEPPIHAYDRYAVQQIFLSQIKKLKSTETPSFELSGNNYSFFDKNVNVDLVLFQKDRLPEISINDDVIINMIEGNYDKLKELSNNIKRGNHVYPKNNWLITRNPFFFNGDKNRTPLRFQFKQITYSGFTILKYHPQPFNITKDNYYDSKYNLLNVSRTYQSSQSHKTTVTLLIKVCFQDHLFLETQILHIIKQCELPRKLDEILVVVDQKESQYLRQYSKPQKIQVLNALSRLKKQNIIDDFFLSPVVKEEIEGINSNWFGVISQETHSITNVPITPQLFGFEKSSSNYVLQVDLDVLICRRDIYHDFIGDMISEIENDPYVLSVGMNITKTSKSDFQPYSSNHPNSYVPEVRFCLFNKKRLLQNRPYPNEIINGKLKYTWYRSIEQYQLDSKFKSLRGGDPRSFYIHPPNHYKSNPDVINEIQDRIEQKFIPNIQLLNVDLCGDLKDWQFPKRSEQVIFIMSGRNVSSARFERCWQSVMNQKSRQWGAIIIDDASDNSLAEYISFTTRKHRNKTTLLLNRNRKEILYNINNTIRNYCINPYSIIVTLDSDDCLISNFVVSHLIELYDTGVQITVGSTLRKQKGILPFVPNLVNPRNMRGGDVWMHLRSFRKYLFDEISEIDFLDKHGNLIDKFNELTFMIPMIEMAQRKKFIQWPLYYYDPEHKRNPEHYELNKRTIEFMISKRKYEKLHFKSYPWTKPPGEILNLITGKGEIIIIRHGEKQKTKKSDLQISDEKNELTEYGKAMARKFGSNFSKTIDIAISSPLKRCIQTAEEVIDGNQSNINIVVTNVFAGFNRFSMIKWREHKDLFGYGPAILNWLKGKMEDNIIEKFEDYLQRLIQELKEISIQYKNKTVLIVTHDHVLICMLYYYYNHINLRIPYLHGLILDGKDKVFQNKFLKNESFNLNTISP